MTDTAEQFIAINKANAEALQDLANHAFSGFQKLVELNLASSKANVFDAFSYTRAVLDAKERARLEKEIIEKKVQLEFPKIFKQLRDQANPQLFLGKHAQTEEELAKQVKEALTSDATPGLPTHPPHGN